MEVHPAAGDILEEVAFELDAHGSVTAGEVKHAGDETGNLIGEVTAEDRGFEANYHYLP